MQFPDAERQAAYEKFCETLRDILSHTGDCVIALDAIVGLALEGVVHYCVSHRDPAEQVADEMLIGMENFVRNGVAELSESRELLRILSNPINE